MKENHLSDARQLIEKIAMEMTSERFMKEIDRAMHCSPKQPRPLKNSSICFRFFFRFVNLS